jgi:hypothetical protein
MVKLGAVNRSILRYVRFAATTLGGELVGLSRLELPTSPLSGVRSNHLSYRPALTCLFVLSLRYIHRSFSHVLLVHSFIRSGCALR